MHFDIQLAMNHEETYLVTENDNETLGKQKIRFSCSLIEF